MFFTTLRHLLNHNIWIKRDSVCVRARSVMNGLIFEKLLRISLINANEHSEGAIINYL